MTAEKAIEPEALVDQLTTQAYAYNRGVGLTAKDMQRLGFSADLELKHQYMQGFSDGQTSIQTERKNEVDSLRTALRLAIEMLERSTFESTEIVMLKYAAGDV